VCRFGKDRPCPCLPGNTASTTLCLCLVDALQVTQGNDCYWLGQLKGMEWGLINEAKPSDGVELYYFDGEPCAGGLTRDVIIKFLCDPLAGAGAPEAYHVLENECHYSVNWPTSYACPTSSAKRSWGIIQMGVFIFVVYTVAGCAFNVVKYVRRSFVQYVFVTISTCTALAWGPRQCLTASSGGTCLILFEKALRFPSTRCASCRSFNADATSAHFMRRWPCSFTQQIVTISQARELLGKKPTGYQQSTDAGDYEWG
jgi:hypothetical protein